MDGVTITARCGDLRLPALERVLDLALRHPKAGADDDGADLITVALAAHEGVTVYLTAATGADMAAHKAHAALSAHHGLTVIIGHPPLTEAQCFGMTPEEAAHANKERQAQLSV